MIDHNYPNNQIPQTLMEVRFFQDAHNSEVIKWKTSIRLERPGNFLFSHIINKKKFWGCNVRVE